MLSRSGQVGKIGEPVSFENACMEQISSVNAVMEKVLPIVEPTSSHKSCNNLTREGILSSNETHSIASLTPYQNNEKNWIKARVISKSLWNSGKGFNIVLKDESGEIRATIFSPQFKKFYKLIEAGSVYLIWKYKLQFANKNFNKLNHAYEITFNESTIVQFCKDDGKIPHLSVELVPISNVRNLEKETVIDVIGVCKNVEELKTVKNNYKLRILTLIDSSGFINLELWEDMAVNCSINSDDHPVLLARELRIIEYRGGKSLRMSKNNLKINPDIPEAYKLHEWFLNGGADNVTNNVSAWIGPAARTDLITFQDVYDRGLGFGNKPDYFQCKAVVRNINPNILYKACPQNECHKKVVDESNGLYRCESCKAAYPNFKYRLLIKVCNYNTCVYFQQFLNYRWTLEISPLVAG